MLAYISLYLFSNKLSSIVTGIFCDFIFDTKFLSISLFTINSLTSNDNILYIMSELVLYSEEYISPVVISE